MVTDSLIDVRKIATHSNASDVFTKVLTPIEHNRSREVLMGSAALSTLGFIMCLFGT
jgi:4'-phosphopantetheinyl transferase EntD